MKRLPNIREVVEAVRTTVKTAQTEKTAAQVGPQMSVDVARLLQKVALEIKDGSFAPVSYNDVMNFGAQVKEAFQK